MAYSLRRGAVFERKEATEKDQLQAPLPALGVVSGRVEGLQALHSPAPPPFLDGGGIWLLLPPHRGPRFTSPFRPHTDLNHSMGTSWGCLPHLRFGVLLPVDNCSSPCTCGRAHDPVPDHQGTALPWPRRQVREPQAQHCS